MKCPLACSARHRRPRGHDKAPSHSRSFCGRIAGRQSGPLVTSHPGLHRLLAKTRGGADHMAFKAHVPSVIGFQGSVPNGQTEPLSLSLHTGRLCWGSGPMTKLDDRSAANMEVVLEEVCRELP